MILQLSNLIKKLIKFFLIKFSRVIYWLIPSEFKNQPLGVKKILDQNIIKENYEFFKSDFEKSVLFEKLDDIRSYAINTALKKDKEQKFLYLEFGVYQGNSTNFFSKKLKKFYAFDSFEGLEEDWVGRNKPTGYFDLKQKIPKLNKNVNLSIGKVQDTLDNFLNNDKEKINFVHLDFDTYKPTKFVLEKIKPLLTNGSILIFDQFYNYAGWKDGEYRAFKEVFNSENYSYKAFNVESRQCVIQIKN